MQHSFSRGFTLIELLVVIAIIGMLSSVVLASLNTARSKARDARRIADIKTFQTAMAMYYDDHKYYPSCATEYLDSQSGCLYSALVPTYIGSLPVDPRYGNNGTGIWGQDYQYFGGDVGGGSNFFNLRAWLEGEPLPVQGRYPGTASGYCGVTLPACDWYQSCVYKGCAETLQIGSTN